MSRVRGVRCCAWLALLMLASDAGCQAPPTLRAPQATVTRADRPTAPAALDARDAAQVTTSRTSERAVQTVAHFEPTSEQDLASEVIPPPHGAMAVEPVTVHGAYLTGPDGFMSADVLVAEILARNPNVAALAAAWRAEAERFPQAVSLDDPMFMAAMAPDAFGSDMVDDGYMLQLRQKFPWFGKRAAAGRIVRAETSAAFHDVRDARVMLAETARMAFFDYYVVRRLQELNRANLEVVRSFRDTADIKYRTNQVTQQDVLQADVELAELERRAIELTRLDAVAVARINTLLRVPPQSPLPPPPPMLPIDVQVVDVELAHQLAIAQRPDLAALLAKVRAEQAAVELARKQYCPDVDVMGRYDALWQERELRALVGAEINLPVYRARLNAAVREAAARVAQRRAEYDQRLLEVRYEVEAAYAEVEESRQTIRLYDERLIPIARQNVSTTRANYDVAVASFLDLAVAERQLIELLERREEAIADYYRRLARLARSVGGPLPVETSDALGSIQTN